MPFFEPVQVYYSRRQEKQQAIKGKAQFLPEACSREQGVCAGETQKSTYDSVLYSFRRNLSADQLIQRKIINICHLNENEDIGSTDSALISRYRLPLDIQLFGKAGLIHMTLFPVHF